MMTDKWVRLLQPLKDRQDFLKIMVFVYMMLPLLYLIYIQLVSEIIHVGIREMLSNDVNASLDLVSNFTCVYSAFAIFQAKKDMGCRENLLSFYILLLAQIMARIPVAIMMMLIYVFHFIGVRNIISEFHKTVWKKSCKALFPAVGVFIVSLIVLLIRMKIFL